MIAVFMLLYIKRIWRRINGRNINYFCNCNHPDCGWIQYGVDS